MTRIAWAQGARSETGYRRHVNEDRMGWVRTPCGDAFIVCDGMGGHGGGACAAELALQVLQRQLQHIEAQATDTWQDVRRALAAANAAVHAQRGPPGSPTGEMGTTAVLLLLSGERAIVGHVGDSRAYLWRPTAGLQPLTRDHTRVQRLVDDGLLDSREASMHPDAGLLERAIGHQPEVDADVSDWIDVAPGDTLLLCSDGLWGLLGDEAMAALLAEGDAPAVAADRLVDGALCAGGDDNITVQLVQRVDTTAQRRAVIHRIED
jgi:serine/threonine protein phosphatase PrpC